ncbi:ATP-dependent DNA helicase PIF1 [Entomortierella parvispora]|uniref:ATP-dependent DNA helicase PIF1 n=1 Tax=Entomortierella parvispora TaxID=205924 RepID=A0A9P3H7D8_9FUNG|nr:ATP-dependent DNA helicase PIF1 [Entomortierella parvispora]
MNGFCNGTRRIVKETYNHIIIATFATGEKAGQQVTLCPIYHPTFEDGSTPVPITRLQFPIKPAFAMTINKSQGQTLNHVAVFLSQRVFSHGQLYVALSRCTNPDNLKVFVADGAVKGQEGTYTRNVVYRQVLEW